MKRKYILLLTSCISLAIFIFISLSIRQKFAAPVPRPCVPGGYYKTPFTLTFSVPSGGAIYYTTDGSTPTIDSQLYQDGIQIENRSSEPNIYNAVQNIVEDWKTYSPDPTPVEKGTVIRAIFVNSQGIVSDVLTQTYFVGVEPPEKGYTLSLVFEKELLFGDDGIYVTGREYDQWYLSGGESGNAPTPNFEKDIEVPAHVELLSPKGNILNQPIGLRLQGNTARAEYKKRFTLTARENLSGRNTFDAPLFDNILTHSVMLKSYLPDAIVADISSDRSVSVQQSIPVRVYLNGEFWYQAYMLERYDRQYFYQHYGINNRILVKNGVTDPESLAAYDTDFYGEFMYWAANTDFSAPEEWESLQSVIDVQSYIDYIAINYYLCNIDFGDYHNYVLFRSATEGKTPYSDTRWRWCIFDIDALEWIQNDPSRGDPAEINLFSNDLTFNINKTTLFSALRKNPTFCQQFVLSFMDIGNNNFSPAQIERILQKNGQTLDWMDGFFRKRPEYAAQHLAQEFGLTGSLETVAIQTAQPEMGSVQVNTSVIDLSSGTWSGKYFTDYPITVTAIPKDGYTFIGWKGGSGETAPTIQLSMENGPVLEAVFAKVK